MDICRIFYIFLHYYRSQESGVRSQERCPELVEGSGVRMKKKESGVRRKKIVFTNPQSPVPSPQSPVPSPQS
ncbi:hypothetical protein [Dolichospermum sp. UHCC 0259]|uniref:hypothetical protein n=1 Tax=Dolichospermum sp. UHCC 0259 TaxID=2590010 RepID=UPI001444FF96|nr:hypothetical protein [Dolichospermum sp. UHCC 0259]